MEIDNDLGHGFSRLNSLNIELKEELKKLAEKYDINLSGNRPFDFFTELSINKLKVSPEDYHLTKLIFLSIDKDQSEYNYSLRNSEFMKSLSELLFLIRKSIENNSAISFSNNIKGLSSTIKIQNKIFLKDLYESIDGMLFNYQDGLYDHLFNDSDDNSSEFIIHNDIYSVEELNSFMKYEIERNIRSKSKSKRDLSFKIYHIVNVFKKNGVFRNDLKTIGYNESKFLFDSLVQLGLIHDLFYLDNEKYEFIKKELRKIK